MITLKEQRLRGKHKPEDGFEPYIDKLEKPEYTKTIQKGEGASCCYKIIRSIDGTVEVETSYFVGIDWVIEKVVSIYVQPKSNTEEQEINYLKMLFDALKAPESFNHLDQLCEIYFDKPTIAIDQQQDFLTPLLLVQYLSLLKRIVQKGLKKSYYTVTSNLNARIKGRILVNETIKKNHFNNKMVHNYCQYSEFGINSIENKVLKKALLFSISAIQNLKGVDLATLKGLTSYIEPAFTFVDSEVNMEELRTIKTNPLYKEYAQALKLAKYILKRFGYNISSTSTSKVNTPPYWIDMSKLFELYVYSKLKERFKETNEVIYHKKIKGLEPDYLLNSKDGTYKMVVDAKYKPRYINNAVLPEDIRQVSGYARLNEVYKLLQVDKSLAIDCLIIYSSQDAETDTFLKLDLRSKEEDGYNKFYKIGIKLPVV